MCVNATCRLGIVKNAKYFKVMLNIFEICRLLETVEP